MKSDLYIFFLNVIYFSKVWDAFSINYLVMPYSLQIIGLKFVNYESQITFYLKTLYKF